MILAMAFIGSDFVRMSMHGIDPSLSWTYNWEPKILSFTSPQWKMPETWGGLLKFTFGSIEFSPDTFEDSWPPPANFHLELFHTTSNDDSKVSIFLGKAHRASIKSNSITYDLYDYAYDQDFLVEVEDYNGDEVVLPRVFGWCYHLICVRLPDVGGYPTYHNGYLTGALETSWLVYDDGVDITDNVVNNGDYTFYLTADPVGTVSVTGSADYEYLSDLVEYCAGRMGLLADTTLWHGDIDEHPSADIRYVAKSQEKIIDFVSRACSELGHMAYIK